VGPKKATNAPPGSFAFSGHDRTHAHMIQADSSGRFVLHVDLGLDRIFVWKFDARRGVLTPNDPPAVSLPPGDGPRHFFFHPNGRWCYSLQEEGSNIVLFDYDAAKGRLEGNGPGGGTLVEHRVCLVSPDWLAADRVAVELMGIDYAKVGYLNYCAQAGFGEGDLEKIEIVGEPIAKHVRRYKLADHIDKQLIWMTPPKVL